MIPVAFDMRDPVRSGIARVARCMARSFAEVASGNDFALTFAGPADRLAALGVHQWGHRAAQVVPWNSGRLSLEASLTWPGISRRTGSAVWYFPHWDVPWLASPRRSIVLVSDVIPIIVPGATSPARREVARRWIRRSAKQATRVVVSTDSTRRELLELWPDLHEKVSVLPLGVDDIFFNPPSRVSEDLLKITESRPFMLSVGNRKAHKNLIMGPEVLARVPGIDWIVVGEPFAGWDVVMRRASALRVGHRIHVFDPRPDAVIRALYGSAVCLFFPSRAEGFGLPILEALASGTRVVAGNAGASVEVLGEHGTVCDVDDPDAFAAGVAAALTGGAPDPSGRAHAQNYTWERSARRLAGLVREVSCGD